MEPDAELETWRRQWQQDEAIPADLRQRVERETRSLRRGRYAELAVTVIIGGGAAGWALASRGPLAATFAAGIWCLIAIAWMMSLGLRRNIARPSAATTTAFLELSIRRCRRRLRAGVAQAVLYVMILAFDLVWIYHYHAQTQAMEPWTFLTSGVVLAAWAITALLAAAAVWNRRRLQRELQSLLDLRQRLCGR